MNHLAVTDVEFRHFHLYCGLGGGAKGFNKNSGRVRVGNLRARWRCIGGIDVDPAAIADFSRAAGVAGTVLDLFSEEQYRAFHGKAPAAGWRQATPNDIRRAAHGELPNVVFLSAPCKGFSGLLPEKSSATDKYQALNGLTLRGIWLMLEAFQESLPELIVFENVPRIFTRGRHLLDQIVALLRAYGYAVAETTHDCGELGGLGQSRKRFLLVARLAAKVPPFLYEPEKKSLRGVGEILERLPMPGCPSGGPMHRMPALQWKTWVRLAFVEAGSDWRSLNKLAVENGVLRDFGIMPDAEWQASVLGVLPWDVPSGVVAGRSSPTNGAYSVADPRAFGIHHGAYGVRDWTEPSGVVTSKSGTGTGTFSVADPRIAGHEKSVQMGVRPWSKPSGVVTGKMFVGGGPNAVADPRIAGKPRFNNVFRIVPWQGASPAVAGPGGPAGGLAVADPRPAPRDDYKQTKYRVTAMNEAAGTVIAASTTGNGAYAVADPRPAGLNAKRDHYQTGGHYGVVPWGNSTRAVPGFAKYDRGPFAVADPREAQAEPLAELPNAEDRLVAVIRALDGTWHRPFTTLELAALQSLFDPDEEFVLEGQSDSAWRERIGNAVPPDAAEAVAGVMATTMLLAMTGQTFILSNQPIWVRPLAMALSIDDEPNRVMLREARSR